MQVFGLPTRDGAGLRRQEGDRGGALSLGRLESYRKLQRELSAIERKKNPKLMAAERKKMKKFSRVAKEILKKKAGGL